MRQIVLDVETTGLEASSGHRIIEIGCVEILNRRPTGQKFHRYLNPEREIDAGALAVHGIELARLEQAPKFAQIAPDLIAFISGAELIIHNAPFDVGFLDAELARLAGETRTVAGLCRVLDTLALARSLHPGQRNSLDALCKRYSVDNSKRDLHGALLDAGILVDVYLAMTGGQSALALDVSAGAARTRPGQRRKQHCAGPGHRAGGAATRRGGTAQACGATRSHPQGERRKGCLARNQRRGWPWMRIECTEITERARPGLDSVPA